jgi:ribosomal protein S18 acetylase RimI-like enzyme
MMAVRGATLSDVDAIADLHLLTFPGYFLSHFGRRFLRLFNALYLANENSHCIVAVDADRVIGFIAGTSDTIQHFSAFYRRKFVQIALVAAVGFLRDPLIRRESVKRADHLRLAATALLRPRPQPLSVQEEESGQTPAQLLSIAVRPDHRGKGVAGRLTAFYISQLRRDRVCSVRLTVRSDNTRAIAFFKKDGWIPERTTSESTYLHRCVAEEYSA